MSAPEAPCITPQAEAAAHYSQARARQSLFVAFGLATFLHVAALALLVKMVIFDQHQPEPAIIVAIQHPSAKEQVMDKRQLLQLKGDRPSAPSGGRGQVIVSRSLATVAVPEISLAVDAPTDLGSGWGEGFGAGLGGTGTGAGMTFFGTPAAGRCALIVIDVSTSMPENLGGAGIAALRKEIDRTINALSPRTRFNLICFGNQADGFQEMPVIASAVNKQAAIRFMADYFTEKFRRTRTESFGRQGELEGVRYVPITPDDFSLTRDTTGGSRYDLALIAAFHQQPETIYLLTDGNPSTARGGDSLSREEILGLVRQGAEQASPTAKPRIHCVSVNGVGGDYLKEIAKAFQGEYREIKGASVVP